MITTFVLKCVLLAKAHVLVLETPVSEYGMASINQTYNGVDFEATVVEEKMTSILIRFPKSKAETIAYSTRDYDMKSLSTQLTVNKEHATIDCDILDFKN